MYRSKSTSWQFKNCLACFKLPDSCIEKTMHEVHIFEIMNPSIVSAMLGYFLYMRGT